jgi:hypothetical protein
LQRESNFSAHAPHCEIVGKNASDDSPQVAPATNVYQQLQQVGAQPFALPRVADQNSELSFISFRFLAQACDTQNLMRVVRILEVGDDRKFARMIDGAVATQSFVKGPLTQTYIAKIPKVTD